MWGEGGQRGRGTKREGGGQRGRGDKVGTGTLAQAACTALPLGACPKGTSHNKSPMGLAVM